MSYIDDTISLVHEKFPGTTKIGVSLIGYLNGDSWTILPLLVGLGEVFDVRISCGMWSQAVWKFAQKEVVGANFTIDYIVDDATWPSQFPKDRVCKYWAPWGYPAIMPGYDEFVARADYPVLHPQNVPAAYRQPPTHLKMKTIVTAQKPHIFVQGRTHDPWKSQWDIAFSAEYKLPAYSCSYPTEQCGKLLRCEDTLYAKVKTCLEAKFVVTVLSSFSIVAALFQKRQIIVACTPNMESDMTIMNPNAIYLTEPTIEVLQETIEMCENE